MYGFASNLASDFKFVLPALAMLLSCGFSVAAITEDGLSDAAIEENLRQAQEQHAERETARVQAAETEPQNIQVTDNPAADALSKEFMVDLTPTQAQAYHAAGLIENLPLGQVRVAVDVEQQSIRDVINLIVHEAAPASGLWQVRWRLEPQHAFILEEKVNLTAETTFDQFLGFMVERINNLTGVQLFVSKFEQSRLIILSDTTGRG